MKTMMKNFRSPGAQFRSAPFWAWNAKLNEEELIRQIHVFKEMGMGGFFMHARVGLNTAYLRKEWFDCVKVCVNEAKKLGMQAHLYDEDRWPSGAAGSLVTRDDRYKSRYCKVEIYSRAVDADKTGKGKTLAWFSAIVSGSMEKKNLQVKSPRRLSAPEQFKSGHGRKLLRFAEFFMDRSSWYNGETYLDTLNPEAVEKFVEVTHAAYYREVGSEFGGAIPSIFTDEPNFCARSRDGIALPWTSRIPEIFRSKYQRDVLDCLPEIFFSSVRKYSLARYQYLNLLTELFCTAFSKTIGDWCGKHNIRMTGHVLMEDSLIQSLFVGAAMRFYEYMQSPGIDLLTEHWRIFNTVKQCTSVAHQFGRKWRLSETYGCTGWDFPFAGHKALGDWQYALGINFRCPHLAWYSAEAEAKRDYPASISGQSPWYDKYHVVEDYFGRLGAIMSEGEEICDLLVIHPIESAWLGIDISNPVQSLKMAEKRFVSVSAVLLGQKLDFNFGDEEIMSRFGRVRDGKLIINRAAYKAVLIPRLHTIRSTTLNLLNKFAEQGGTVVYLDAPPAYLDGIPSKKPGQVFARFRRTVLKNAVELLEASTRRVSVTNPAGHQIGPVLARLADTGKVYSLFLCNYGAEFKTSSDKEECMVRDRKLRFPEADVSLKVPKRGRVYELNPADGTVWEVKAIYKHGQYHFKTSFDVLESHLYLVTEEDPGRTVTAQPVFSAGPVRRLPVSEWDYELSEPNVLILDHADWSVDGHIMGKNEYILKLDDALRAYLGKPPRGGEMVQPWLREQTPPEKTVPLELVYHIRIEKVPKEEVFLAVEHPEFYQFELNGKKFTPEVKRWWCDRILQCITLPVKWLKVGENRLTLRTGYHENLPGLESLFLLGKFGVRDDVLTVLPEKLSLRDWGKQGLCYYAGNVTYSRMVNIPENGAVLELDDWRGVLLGIRIGNAAEKLFPWPPYRVKIPAGRYQLFITVYGSRRNAMGPFYCNTAWPFWTGPAQFKALIVPERQLVPCGLLTAPLLKRIT